MMAPLSSQSSGLSALSSQQVPSHLKKYHLWDKEDVFVLNLDDRVLTLLREGELLAQCTFSNAEFYVCALLLTFYPTYAPIEELLTILIEKPVEDCLKQLNEAVERGYDSFYHMTLPVRHAISRCRKQLAPFGVTIHAIDLTGYELRPLVVRGQRPHVRVKR
jgi:hypothetical protein